jgi:acetyl-CoA C-acetyltransferase
MKRVSAHNRDVYIIDGYRTPFLKARGRNGPFSAAELGILAARQLLNSTPIDFAQIDEVVTGCVMPASDEANISRVIALRLGLSQTVPAWTVQRNCASGLQAIDSGSLNIFVGNSQCVLAGGTEAMSRAPLILAPAFADWLAEFRMTSDLVKKISLFRKFKSNFLIPEIALIKGLTDPVVSLSMGQTAENVAYRFGITRREMDEFARQSHQRLASAIDNNLLTEIVTLYDQNGQFYRQDDGLRRETTLEKLGQLQPFFDKPYGSVTAGSSSQVTDGAAFLLLASADMVKNYQLPVLGKIIDVTWAGVDPAEMGLGPAHAIVPLLHNNHLKLDDIDYWEINEAFSAQVLGVIRALADKKYCQEHFQLNQPLGEINQDRLNVDGGAIALGHPVGASGARIVLHLLKTLQRKQARYGVASLCIGGGQGGAILLEHVTGVAE